jgi:hypothetical protein
MKSDVAIHSDMIREYVHMPEWAQGRMTSHTAQHYLDGTYYKCQSKTDMEEKPHTSEAKNM